MIWNLDNPLQVRKTKINPSYRRIIFGENSEQLLAYRFMGGSECIATADYNENIRKLQTMNGDQITSTQIPKVLPNKETNDRLRPGQTYVYCPTIKKYFFINYELAYHNEELITINLLDPETCEIQELESFDSDFSVYFDDQGKRMILIKGECHIVDLIERYQNKL